jgi:hypothetical protein
MAIGNDTVMDVVEKYQGSSIITMFVQDAQDKLLCSVNSRRKVPENIMMLYVKLYKVKCKQN